MSEEIKVILDYLEDDNWDYYPSDGIPYKVFLMQERDLLLNYITNLQQKVEQLEKENKELKQPQVFIDCEDMEERYGRDLYEDYLKGKIEQLENIRKEAIKLIKKYQRNDEFLNFNEWQTRDLLNILNKGSDKE